MPRTMTEISSRMSRHQHIPVFVPPCPGVFLYQLPITRYFILPISLCETIL